MSSWKPHGSCVSTRSLWLLNVYHNTIRPLCISNSISVRVPARIEQSSFPLRFTHFLSNTHVEQNHAETPTMLALAGCNCPFVRCFLAPPSPFSSENGSAMYGSSSMTLRTKRARTAGHKTCHPSALETSFTLNSTTKKAILYFLLFSFLLDHVASKIAVMISVLRTKKIDGVG